MATSYWLGFRKIKTACGCTTSKDRSAKKIWFGLRVEMRTSVGKWATAWCLEVWWREGGNSYTWPGECRFGPATITSAGPRSGASATIITLMRFIWCQLGEGRNQQIWQVSVSHCFEMIRRAVTKALQNHCALVSYGERNLDVNWAILSNTCFIYPPQTDYLKKYLSTLIMKWFDNEPLKLKALPVWGQQQKTISWNGSIIQDTVQEWKWHVISPEGRGADVELLHWPRLCCVAHFPAQLED